MQHTCHHLCFSMEEWMISFSPLPPSAHVLNNRDVNNIQITYQNCITQIFQLLFP